VTSYYQVQTLHGEPEIDPDNEHLIVGLEWRVDETYESLQEALDHFSADAQLSTTCVRVVEVNVIEERIGPVHPTLPGQDELPWDFDLEAE
jgi:hypothetical protein